MADGNDVKTIHSMKTQLLLWFLGVSLIPLILVGALLWWQANSALNDAAYERLQLAQQIKSNQIDKYFVERQGDMGVLMETVDTLRTDAINQLQSVRDIKKTQVGNFFAERMGDARVLAANPAVIAAFNDLQPAFEAAGGVSGNQLIGEGNGRFQAPSSYRTVHDEHFTMFDYYMNQYGYYDIFLLDPVHGDVIFSVTKEGDFAQRSDTLNTTLTAAWQKALANNDAALSDMEAYAPSNGAPAQFVAAPIQENGETIGVVAMQISNEAINAIMAERSGLGETGETYLIGPDKLMRSDSYLDPENHSVSASLANPAQGQVDTESATAALGGETAADVIIDYNGNPVLSAFTPIELDGFTWGLLAEIDVAEAFNPLDENGESYYQNYTDLYGYYDLFLVNPDGYVFFSVAQEPDYQTNMLTGQFSDSNLGQLVAQTLQSKAFGFADFAPYAPSNGDPAAFIAQPVVHQGDPEIIVALQLPLAAINDIMQARTGMGETGETYLVGPDKLMRSDSYLDPDGHSVTASFAGTVAANGVDTVATEQALAGKSGQQIVIDYNGNPVLSVYSPLQVFDTRWAVIAEMDEWEAFAAATQMRNIALGMLGVAALIVTIIAVLVARSMANPILQVARIARRLAVGDAELAGMDTTGFDKIQARKDELGLTGRSFAALIGYFKEMAVAANQLANGDLTANVTPKAEVDQLGNAFKQMIHSLRELVGQVADVANTVGSASMQLSGAAEQAGQATSQVAATIQQVAAGTASQATSMTTTTNTVGQVSHAIQGVAIGAQEQASAAGTATEITAQMDAVIQQVAQNAQSGADGANRASDAARNGATIIESTIEGMQSIKQTVGDSAGKVKEMGRRSAEIGDIIETIDEIASQTNLLALNAAIEAARAGEHGKGFAVVADEVRKLAEKSAIATREIAALIKDIQGSVDAAVLSMDQGTSEVERGVTKADEAAQALAEILESVDGVSHQSSDIAAAAQQMRAASHQLVSAIETVSSVIEENTAATQQMSAGATEVMDAIEGVAGTVEENSAAVEEVSASAEEMSAQTEEVSASAQSLGEMAEQLTVLIGRFKLGNIDGLLNQIEMFKNGHRRWVDHLSNMMAGREVLHQENITDHTECTLGQWYYQRGQLDYGQWSEFIDIEAPHAEMHKMVHEAVVAFNRGDRARAEQLAEQVSQYSHRVISLLDALENRIKRDVGLGTQHAMNVQEDGMKTF